MSDSAFHWFIIVIIGRGGRNFQTGEEFVHFIGVFGRIINEETEIGNNTKLMPYPIAEVLANCFTFLLNRIQQ